MQQIAYRICPLGLLLGILLLFSGCSSEASSQVPASQDLQNSRITVTDFLLPSADGLVTYGNDFVSIDASHTEEGYVMVRWQGEADAARLQMVLPGETTVTYQLTSDSYETFPLTGGDGEYRLDILERAYDNLYALSFSQEIFVSLDDEFRPFLYPNQYAWYTEDSATVALGIQLSSQASGDLDYVDKVYSYVTENISYDAEAAKKISVNYIPDVDATLSSKKGICFDYAALMTALLRSQGIPTRLEVGYSGTIYHAWISVYLTEAGWIDKIIEFDGKSWSLMDPTLAAANDRSSVKAYIGDGSGYTVKYYY